MKKFAKKSNLSPLKVEDIYKNFKKKTVLEEITFGVENGEIFGLIGLNGAGKTTLIKIILGLLKQDKGAAHIFGENASNTLARKNISFLPEKFQPSHFLKGTEFLSLSLAYYGKKYNPKEAKKIAEGLDLDPNVLDLKITKYSKGMGQKLGLLSAFLTRSPFLILDEPMSGLDPSARIKLKDTLLNYAKTGNTIFFSSHILSDIDEICDRIAILHNNKMLFLGKPADFKKKYGNKNLERAFLKSIEGKPLEGAEVAKKIKAKSA